MAIRRPLLAALTLASGLVLAAPLAADEVDDILARYRTVAESVAASRGLFEQDKPAVRSVLRDVEAARASASDDARLWAIDVQLSLWLDEDPERIDAGYTRLESLRPGDSALARTALSWRVGKERLTADEADAAWVALGSRFPLDADLQLERARRLMGTIAYGPIKMIIDGFDPETELPQELLVLGAEAHFADHEFALAGALLDRAGTINSPFDLKQRADELRDWLDAIPGHLEAEQAIRTTESSADDLPRAAVRTSKGTVVFELFENEAPNTVANFISLAESGFYVDTTFHRFLPNFMIQGGDANSKPGATGLAGTGNPGYLIPDEHGDAFPNGRRHFNDSVAMANTGLPDSGGSQFYFNHKPTPWLDGKHTVFGRVIEGREVARSLRADDSILEVTILRKRERDYVPETIAIDAGPAAMPDDGLIGGGEIDLDLDAPPADGDAGDGG